VRIKSDRWTRHMTEQHGMVEPSEAVRLRAADNDDRLISHGTSSYGYHVLCASHCKVFKKRETPSGDRAGKYQVQAGVALPKL
jgi:deoxycytidine triphosphate deaminase